MSAASGEGINEALLRALPPRAKILELGCDDGRLGARYKATHSCEWVGVDVNDRALAIARDRLDRVVKLDLEAEPLESAGDNFELVVMGDVLEHLKEPERVLRALHRICTPGATLAICMPNLAHTTVLERAIAGDVMYDDAGLLDRTHLRIFTPRAFFKMLLDCGWLPAAAGGYAMPHPNAAFAEALYGAAAALGIARAAAEVNLTTYQLIVTCAPVPQAPDAPPATVDLAAVVAVTNEPQLLLNVARSPGLHEIGARLIALRNCDSAASAFAAAVRETNAPWLLICSQNAYLPRGSGRLLAHALDAVARDGGVPPPIGFLGLAGAGDAPARAGLGVEGLASWNYAASDRAIALADFAVVLHRDTALRIDSARGWNGWANDLCSQAAAAGTPARILRVPIFHNSAGEPAQF